MSARRAPPPRASRGFTLLELVAAFAIFAIGVVIALSIGASALKMAKTSADYTRAALHAQALLDELGVGEPLEQGSDAGEFDDGYRWEVAITEQEPPAADTGAIEEIPIVLYHVELVVRWEDGKREAKFSTLRASNPSMGGL
jgi:general secretion pathway protein I